MTDPTPPPIVRDRYQWPDLAAGLRETVRELNLPEPLDEASKPPPPPEPPTRAT